MNIDPRSQVKLYGFSPFLNMMVKLYDSKRLPNKFILSGQKGIGKSTIAYHFINYIFSKNEDHSYLLNKNLILKDNRSYKLVKNNSHPNFYCIDLQDGKKNIEISQIREMINYANKSSFNDKPRFVIIDGIEKLNSNSSNALLKIVEEPNKNLFFILIHDNQKRISATLKSRCVLFKLNLSYNDSVDILHNIIGKKIEDIINEEFINYYFTPGEIINLINFAKENNIDLQNITLKKLLISIINEGHFKKNSFIKFYIFNLIKNYFIKLINNSKSNKNIFLLYYKFVNMYFKCNTYNLNYENLFMEIKLKILYE